MAQDSLSKQIKSEPKIRALFAEMYVAAALADEDWAIYFPRRDVGFDMIATRSTRSGMIIRPIQVKGLYPSPGKTRKDYYGYVGKLSQTHKDMALAIVYFDTEKASPSPKMIAWMPWTSIRKHSRGYKCQPARFVDGAAEPRRDHRRFFDADGLARMASRVWK